MKQTKNQPFKVVLILINITFLLFFNNSRAQYAHAPTGTAGVSDLTAPGGGSAVQPGNNQTVNIDMLSYWKNGTTSYVPDDRFIAVVYDDVSTTSSYLWVYDDVKGTFADIQLNGGSDVFQPDVALLDDPNAPGVNYYVAVIYEDITALAVNLEFYHLTGVNGLALSLSLSNTVKLNSGTNASSDPHIDAAPDPDYNINTIFGTNGVFGMYRYVVSWHENDGMNDKIMAFADDFTSGGTSPTVSATFIDYGIRNDVALSWYFSNPVNNGNYIAYFVYDDPSETNLFHADWDLVNSPNLYSALDNGAILGNPRIEAGNARHTSSGQTRWQAVVEIQPPMTTDHEVHGFYELAAGINSINYSNTTFIVTGGSGNPLNPSGFSVVPAYSPTVAAGSNYLGWTAGASDVGNTEMLAGWYMDQGDQFISLIEDGPDVSVINQGYDYVSQNMTTSGVTTAPNIPALGLTYSSNDGYGLAAAWYDGTDIYFKICGNSYAYYKPTEIKKLPINNELSVYPNPATNWIGISGIETESTYSITDILGKQYTQGILGKTNKPIDISMLPAGMYTVTVNSGNEIKHLKFTKE